MAMDGPKGHFPRNLLMGFIGLTPCKNKKPRNGSRSGADVGSKFNR